jgi:hypothetical protein
LVLPEAPPDHSTISRTRRVIDLETHEAVFTWMLQRLADAGLVTGKTVGMDATTLEGNAALRSILRRDTSERYHDFLTTLAQASALRASLRDGWHAARAPAGAHEHPEAIADSHGRRQSGAPHAAADWRRHAAWPEGGVNALVAALLALIGSLPVLAARHRRTSRLRD